MSPLSHPVQPELAPASNLYRPATASTPSKRKAAYGWLCFAFVLFLLQVLPFLSRRWVTDESWYAGTGYSIAHGHGIRDPAIGPNDLENRFDARPPGTALAIASSFKLFGDGPVTARLGSVAAGFLIVWLVFLLTRDVLGWEGAVVATLVAATDNLIVLTARTARPEALTVAAVLLALLALKQYAKREALAWPFASGFLMAMATMFHITVLGYIVSLAILLIAIDWKRRRFALRGVLAYAGGYVLGLVPFAAWILTAPLGRLGFREEYLSRALSAPLWTKFLNEGQRYSEIFGFNTLHTHGLEWLPIRLPIPLCFIAAMILLWKFRRSWFYVALALLVPSVLWLVYTVNKSPRYTVLLAPVFAMAIGAAIAVTSGRRRLHRSALTLVILLIAAQAGANFVLLRAAAKANYEKVGVELRSLIPPNETAYGSITFWLAFRDRPFISYERTDPWMAARQYGARYFILGDRVMTQGQPGDEDFYRQLNRDLAEVAAHSTLVGHVVDPYYGDLSVYKLDDLAVRIPEGKP